MLALPHDVDTAALQVLGFTIDGYRAVMTVTEAQDHGTPAVMAARQRDLVRFLTTAGYTPVFL